MTQLRRWGPIPIVYYLDSSYHGAGGKGLQLPDAPPGSLAISAEDQEVDWRMEEAGWVRVADWYRPETMDWPEEDDEYDDEDESRGPVLLTLWRMPGLPMPRRKLTRQLRLLNFDNDNRTSSTGFYGCCGADLCETAREDEESRYQWAAVRYSISPPKNYVSIRIWEGEFKGTRLRFWFRLPWEIGKTHGYTLHDTRLI